MDTIWYTDVFPTLGFVAVIGIPYLIQRYVFKTPRGIFAYLFWIFLTQWAVAYLAIGVGKLFGSESMIAAPFMALGAFAFLTIGVIPFILMPTSLLGMALYAIGCLFWPRLCVACRKPQQPMR